eukprot:c8991_g1_i1.p1 GENE.c8991_g1_i1~~c8991_g1_i1.p1  ORF type:complete len:922 (-),score=235.60 c8991_g1_i1:35-2800(-)
MRNGCCVWSVVVLLFFVFDGTLASVAVSNTLSATTPAAFVATTSSLQNQLQVESQPTHHHVIQDMHQIFLAISRTIKDPSAHAIVELLETEMSSSSSLSKIVIGATAVVLGLLVTVFAIAVFKSSTSLKSEAKFESQVDSTKTALAATENLASDTRKLLKAEYFKWKKDEKNKGGFERAKNEHTALEIEVQEMKSSPFRANELKAISRAFQMLALFFVLLVVLFGLLAFKMFEDTSSDASEAIRWLGGMFPFAALFIITIPSEMFRALSPASFVNKQLPVKSNEVFEALTTPNKNLPGGKKIKFESTTESCLSPSTPSMYCPVCVPLLTSCPSWKLPEQSGFIYGGTWDHKTWLEKKCPSEASGHVPLVMTPNLDEVTILQNVALDCFVNSDPDSGIQRKATSTLTVLGTFAMLAFLAVVTISSETAPQDQKFPFPNSSASQALSYIAMATAAIAVIYGLFTVIMGFFSMVQSTRVVPNYGFENFLVTLLWTLAMLGYLLPLLMMFGVLKWIAPVYVRSSQLMLLIVLQILVIVPLAAKLVFPRKTVGSGMGIMGGIFLTNLLPSLAQKAYKPVWEQQIGNDRDSLIRHLEHRMPSQLCHSSECCDDFELAAVTSAMFELYSILPESVTNDKSTTASKIEDSAAAANSSLPESEDSNPNDADANELIGNADEFFGGWDNSDLLGDTCGSRNELAILPRGMIEYVGLCLVWREESSHPSLRPRDSQDLTLAERIWCRASEVGMADLANTFQKQKNQQKQKSLDSEEQELMVDEKIRSRLMSIVAFSHSAPTPSLLERIMQAEASLNNDNLITEFLDSSCILKPSVDILEDTTTIKNNGNSKSGKFEHNNSVEKSLTDPAYISYILVTKYLPQKCTSLKLYNRWIRINNSASELVTDQMSRAFNTVQLLTHIAVLFVLIAQAV